MDTLLHALTSGDDQRAEQAVHALARLGEYAVPALDQLSEDEHPDNRWWAVRALAELPGDEAGRAIRQRLTDSNPHVQYCAAVALRQRPDPQAIPALIDLLASPDSLLAHLASNALAAIGKDATHALLEVLKNGGRAERLAAARALSEIKDYDSISALFAALDEDSALLEYWANEGLERMGIGMAFFQV